MMLLVTTVLLGICSSNFFGVESAFFQRQLLQIQMEVHNAQEFYGSERLIHIKFVIIGSLQETMLSVQDFYRLHLFLLTVQC